MTELQALKEAIEDGDSCIEAYEQVDLEQLGNEGGTIIAVQIALVLELVTSINAAAGVD